MKTRSLAPALGIAALALSACHSYQTFTPPADFSAMGITADDQAGMTDDAISAAMARRPAASFPAVLATAHVQGTGTRWDRGDTRGFMLVDGREAETEASLDRLQALPQIRSVAPLNRLVMSPKSETEKDLRAAAASVHADMVFLYTFDTQTNVKNIVPVVGVVTLGLVPNDQARATTTASGALIDTRTGYVYGIAEATAKTSQLANAWTGQDAVTDCRARAERKALEQLMVQFERIWSGVVEAHGGAIREAVVGE